MADTAVKTGRKQKHHVTSWGETVVGLSHRPSDGRWRVIGTQTTFTEPDERKAVERFRRMQGGPDVELNVLGRPFKGTLAELRSLRDYVREIIEANEREAYAKFAEDVVLRPKWVAEMTGIEQIGYLTGLRPPEPLPSLDELEATWTAHAKCSAVQRKKILKAWKDFRDTTGIAGLGDVTPEVAVAFQDAVGGRTVTRPDKSRGPISGKQQGHIFGGVRRLLTFNKKRGKAVDAIGRALGYLSILTPSESPTSLDPKPIEVADWKKLLANAEGDDRAMVLLMLNAALYLTEVISLEWDDIRDGCVATRRKKTGQCVRVAVLWPETVDALSELGRKGGKLFYTYQGLPIKASGAQRRFAALAEKAGVGVTSSQLRDGAYTAAVRANVTTDLCRILVGHRSGMADHYVLRDPRMVAPACEAIYRHYFGCADGGGVDCRSGPS